LLVISGFVDNVQAHAKERDKEEEEDAQGYQLVVEEHSQDEQHVQ